MSVRRLFFFFILFGVMSSYSHAKDEKYFIYCASSLYPLMQKLTHDYVSLHGEKIELVVGSSSTLAKQISEGAQADMYISANALWMNYVVSEANLNPDNIQKWITNTLFLVAHDKNKALSNNESFLSRKKLAKTLKGKNIVIGNPRHVPLGMYTKQALDSLDIWDVVKKNVIFARNSQAVTRFIVTGEADYAFLYASDVKTYQLNSIEMVPPETYKKISYQYVFLNQEKNNINQYINEVFLSDMAKKNIKEFGFGL